MRGGEPKGKLIIIGGREDKGDDQDVLEIKTRNKDFKNFDILNEMLPKKNTRKQTIEIITTASKLPTEINEMYRKAFKRIGYEKVGFINVETIEESRNPALALRINKSHAVLFSGGDQFRLLTILGGTELIDVIRERFRRDKNFILAGTSAGAMVMSILTIYEGGVYEAMLRGDVKLSSGFHFFDDCIIDTHFIKRGRFGRLAHAVVMNPICLGIGLGEDTALIIKGDIAECRGSGMVVIIDGKQITCSNISDAAVDSPVYVESLKVHLLVNGCRFRLSKRKFATGQKVTPRNVLS